MMKLSPLVKVPLRYGAIAGVLGAVIVIALYYIGKHPFLFPIYFDFRIILFAVFMVFTLREYRDFYRQGVLYFWEGLIMCVLMVTAFAVISSVLIYIFGLYDEQFVKSFIVLFTEQAKNLPPEIIKQIGKVNLESNLREVKTTDSYRLAKNYFDQSYILSFFLTIIISVILRRQPKN